jgi:hypothetical protein
VLEEVLTGRLIFAPRETFYEIRGVGSLGRVITAALSTTTVVTPGGSARFRLTVPLETVYRRAV